VDTGDAAPVSQQPYRRTPADAANLEYHIRQSIAQGVLKPHVGAWATPAFVVKQRGKPHGRMVCDYRRLNSVTKRLHFPMPNLSDLLRRVSGSKYFTGVDAVSGFNQLNLTARAQERLAITTPTGTYSWLVLPFGPLNGPQAFQLVMSRIFGSHNEHSAIYIDDVAIFS
jgi:hypothetical protein